MFGNILSNSTGIYQNILFTHKGVLAIFLKRYIITLQSTISHRSPRQSATESASPFWCSALHGDHIQKFLICDFDNSNHFRLQNDKNETFFPMLSIFGLGLLLLTVRSLLPLVLLKTKIIVEHFTKVLRGKAELLGENLVPEPWPPNISREPAGIETASLR